MCTGGGISTAGTQDMQRRGNLAFGVRSSVFGRTAELTIWDTISETLRRQHPRPSGVLRKAFNRKVRKGIAKDAKRDSHGAQKVTHEVLRLVDGRRFGFSCFHELVNTPAQAELGTGYPQE
jgi:hypothetical protein